VRHQVRNTSSEISGLELDATLRKIKVKFTGQPSTDQATIQFFAEGAIGAIS